MSPAGWVIAPMAGTRVHVSHNIKNSTTPEWSKMDYLHVS